MEVCIKEFGRFNGVEYDEIQIESEGKFKISFSNLGARINSWSIPNNDGEMKSIILGYSNARHVFESPGSYFGATIGRVAGRIANSQFELDGRVYYLAENEGVNHLHGGPNNMAFQKWAYTIDEIENGVQVIFSYLDLDGKNGYPGNINIEIKHTVTEDNEWIIEYQAVTDQKTLFNPTNHVYFNLNGHNKENTKNHIIELHADYFLPLEMDSIPTGEVLETVGTPFALSEGVQYGHLLESDHAQFKQTSGFDHPFLLNKNKSYDAKLSVAENKTSLYMQTEEPCVVIYTYQDISTPTKVFGREVQGYDGITLETQKEPDAINHPDFHSIILSPDEIYRSRTKYWLVTDK